MFGQCVGVVIDSMPMNCSVGMPVRNDMTMVSTRRMAENKAEVVVARVAGRRFGSGDEDTLDGKGHRGRHHDDGSHTPKKWTPSKAQRTGSEVSLNKNTMGDYGMTSTSTAERPTSVVGPTLPSAASVGHGSYLGISCRHWAGARRLNLTLSGPVAGAVHTCCK